MKQRMEQAKDRADDTVRDRVPDPLVRLVDWLRSDEFLVTSSSLAFYALISIPPMALIGLWVTGTMVDDETLRQLGSTVDGESPDEIPVGDTVQSLVDVATRVGAFSIIGAAWPATAYGAALARAFNHVTTDEQRRVQGWKGRLFALGIVALLPAVVFGALALLFFLPQLLDVNGAGLTVVLAAGALVAFAAVVSVIYSLFRLRDTKPKDVVLAVASATALQAVVTAGYLLYLTTFADFEERYGSAALATTVLLGLWLMLSNAVLLIGYRLMVKRALRRAPDGDVREADVDEHGHDGSDESDADGDEAAESRSVTTG